MQRATSKNGRARRRFFRTGIIIGIVTLLLPVFSEQNKIKERAARPREGIKKMSRSIQQPLDVCIPGLEPIAAFYALWGF